MTLDLRAAEFWDLTKVDAELRRVYDLCAGCRRCVGLCPSFKVMLDRIDAGAVDGDVEKLSTADVKEVVDLCYQCKLCYNHCPYTPPHRWAIDFPRLMLRARAAQTRRDGLTLQDRLLGNTALVGTLGRLTAPLSNWANELAVHRAFLQAVAGIHKDRNLPKFARETFTAWWGRRGSAPGIPRLRGPSGTPVPEATSATARGDRGPAGAGTNGRLAPRATAGERGADDHRVTTPASGTVNPGPPWPPPLRVALFYTCTVEYHAPAIGRAAVRVLEQNGVDVSVPPQRCCGMPYLDGGGVEQAQSLIRANVQSLAAAVRDSREIIALGPTCGYMLKQEFPWLDGSEDAKLVARSTRDLFEFLARLQAEGRLNTDFARSIGPIAYHVPCHLRAQNIGTKSADVLRAVPGATVTPIEQCSAVDGTWGFKKEYYELSLKVAAPLFQALGASGSARVATDCPLAALQITQGTGRVPAHPIQILAEAYGLDAD